ncbi:MAG: hypothetical protein K0Q49_920, partial [Haloplasmataceae bacterium]|nr:hypothetical protein [Haloplasmataceae bacterium]
MNKTVITLDGDEYINRIYIQDNYSKRCFFYIDVIDIQNDHVNLTLHFNQSNCYSKSFDIAIKNDDLIKINKLFCDFLLNKIFKFTIKFVLFNLSVDEPMQKSHIYIHNTHLLRKLVIQIS